LCYTADLLSASEAFTIGLADKVFSDAQFFDQVQALAELIASKAPLAVQGAKKVINRSQETTLLSGLRLEVEEFLRLFGTADREEGMDAFLQKRKPAFTGR
jgi:enoyl-CoA hydratase